MDGRRKAVSYMRSGDGKCSVTHIMPALEMDASKKLGMFDRLAEHDRAHSVSHWCICILLSIWHLLSFRVYSAGALLCPQYVAIRLK